MAVLMLLIERNTHLMELYAPHNSSGTSVAELISGGPHGCGGPVAVVASSILTLLLSGT